MAPLNLHQLYIFHTVATCHSFSKAAKNLSISQPAVSIQIRQLETYLRTSLFQRMPRGVALTDTGSAMFEYTKRIFSLAQELQTTILDIENLKTGKLAIGASTTPGEYILPWIIAQFQSRFPAIEVSLSITNTQTIVRKINDREVDLGMVGSPVQRTGLVSFPYVSDHIVPIAAPSHPLTTAPSIAIDDLNGQTFIMREHGSATRQTAESFLAKHGVTIQIGMELESNEAVKSAVAAGLGLGLVSTFGISGDITAGFIKTLAIPSWDCHRTLIFFYSNNNYMSTAQKAFLKFLQEEHPLPKLQVT